jgi:hypothetical protein
MCGWTTEGSEAQLEERGEDFHNWLHKKQFYTQHTAQV